MIRLAPIPTRTDTLLPDTALVRSLARSGRHFNHVPTSYVAAAIGPEREKKYCPTERSSRQPPKLGFCESGLPSFHDIRMARCSIRLWPTSGASNTRGKIGRAHV